MTGFVIDIVLAALLGITLFFGIRLSRQFAEIRADQEKLARLVEQLNNASDRAEKAVQSMKKAALETGEELQGRIGKGQALFDELEIMIEAGDSLAERLSKIAESSRKAVSDTANDKVSGRSRAERELREAVQGKKGKP